MTNHNTKSIMIGTQARAQKIAFLVPENPPINILRKIGIYCSKVWGGIGSIIIEVNNNSIKKEDWLLLTFYDPDLIYSFTQISDEFNIELNDKILPARIIADYDNFIDHPELFNASTTGIIDDVLLSQVENLEYVTQVQGNMEGECYDEVLFNLGIYDLKSNPWLKNTHQSLLRPYDPPDTIEDFMVRDIKQPYAGKWNSLYCSSPLYLTSLYTPMVRNLFSSKESLVIILYEVESDIIRFWNGRALILSEGNYGKNWILLNKQAFYRSLKQESQIIEDWISRERSQYHQGDATNNVTIMDSKKLSTTKIRIIEKLKLKLNQNIQVDLVQEISYRYSNIGTMKSLPHQSEVYFYNNHATISNPIPTQFRKVFPTGDWILDISLKDTLTGKKRFLLPRYQGLSDLFFTENKINNKKVFDGYSRINKSGDLSLLMNYKINNFVLSLPSRHKIFDKIIRNEKDPNAFGASRPGRKMPKLQGYSSFEISDKGEISRGIENVFKDIDFAAKYLNSRVWRDCFRKMAKEIPESLRINALNRTKKNLNGHLSQPDNLQNLSARILDGIVKTLNVPARSKLTLPMHQLPFSIYEEGFPKEIYDKIIISAENNSLKEIYSQLDKIGKIEFNKEHILHPSMLISIGVLQPGFDIRCNNCGGRYWYSIGDIGTKFTCRGCLKIQPIPINIPWAFKLNELLANGFTNQGAIPPLLTLSKLKNFHKDSFYYLHEQHLYSKWARQKQNRESKEVDLICIIDGRLILGECKEKSIDFKDEELEKIATIAEKMDADEIVFSSMDPTFNRSALKKINFLKNKLKGIREVEILSLTRKYYRSKNKRFAHVPECRHYSRINKSNLKIYFSPYEFAEDKIGPCDECFKVSDEMRRIWKYWPY